MKTQAKSPLGVTIVELIVVITILAVLGTIAFISFQSFARDGRNTTRLADVRNLKAGIEIDYTESGIFPHPTEYTNRMFSGSILWMEGNFGKNTIQQTSALSEVPIDPLTQSEYSYAVTKNLLKYQIGIALEGEDAIDRSELLLHSISRVHASGYDTLVTYISGNYEGRIVTTSTGGTDYILAIPSLITSDHSKTDIMELLNDKSMSYKGFLNLPHSYGARKDLQDYSFDISDQDIILFKGDFDNLEKDLYRKIFYENLAKFYNDSPLRFKKENEDFTSIYIDAYNPTDNISTMACRVTNYLLRIPCQDFDDASILDSQSGALVNTGVLLAASQTGSYIGQWNFGSVFFTQGFQNADRTRSAEGIQGDLSKAIGTQWKVFTQGKRPDLYLGGYDVDGNGNENIIYSHGGKLFLGDIITGGNIWESKVYNVKKILGVEAISSNGEKSIIVALGDDYIIGVVNGLTGELEWNSSATTGPVKEVKPGWPRVMINKYDMDGDGINEYHFKQWYRKYHAMKFVEQGGKVVGETLWSSEGYGNYNNGSDAYQPYQFAMGEINGVDIVATKGANNFAFYSTQVDSSLSGTEKFKMPAYDKLIFGGGGWAAGRGYFYDINNDGNDEHIFQLTEEKHNSKMSRIFVNGLDASNNMTQYMSLSNPITYNGDGLVESYGNHHKPIALKNASSLEDSYILTKGKSPRSSFATDEWMMLKYNGSQASGYKKDSSNNETFNTSIVYDIFDNSYAVTGIFNNGSKDYIVLSKSGKYYFYTFTGTNTFLSPSSLEITGGWRGDNMFADGTLDTQAEKNKQAGILLRGVDTDGNGLKEFVVTNGGYFKFYEITDSGVNLKRSFKYSGIPGSIKWGISDDLQNVYGISYISSTNSINYYRSDSAEGDYTLTQKTDGNFVSGGYVRDILISKLGEGNEKYNKVMIQSTGMFDARNAGPTVAPTKLSNDFYYSHDMDNDNINEVFIGGKAHTYNSPGNYTQKYSGEGWAGDFNGDGVKDSAWAFCKASESFQNNLYFTIRSGIDNSEIVPDLDWGNGNGYCAGGTKYATAGIDFDQDGTDEIIAGVQARSTRTISVQSGSVTEGNQVSVSLERYTLVSYDVDGDGVKEIIRNMDNFSAFKGNPDDNTQLDHLFTMNSGVKGTFGVGGGIPSTLKKGGRIYSAFRGVDGQVALLSYAGGEVTEHFNNYYLNLEKYTSSEQILNNNLIPIPTADVLLGDFIGDDTLQVLVGGGDGYIYILDTDGDIRKAYNIGSSIKRIIFGDTNEDGTIDILVSAEDGYIHKISSSLINPPGIIRDGQYSGYDDRRQSNSKQSGLHFSKVIVADGYFVQLYNKSKKSAVFDWVDVGDKTSLCIKSSEVTSSSCISAGRKFELIGGNVYQWRVQSYDEKVASPIALSNGFILE